MLNRGGFQYQVLSWVAENEIYTITYPGTDMTKDVVSMKESPEGMLLENVKGEILALRE